MENSNAINAFLERHNFKDIKLEELTDALYKDMELGLKEQDKSEQLMAVMPFPIDLNKRSGKTIVIDAGGTNFRSCLVEFSENGEIIISDEKKSSMIALDREYGKEEFFEALEDKINYLKDKADEIHFCFSYAMKNMPDGDAQVLTFSKQVRAKAVEGSYIGKELKQILEERGWTTVKKIKVINDTVACLLSGLSLDSLEYDSYIGFILGTGINNAYIEKGEIAKVHDELKERIVVCECGMFRSMDLSDFDKALDSKSTNPGCSLLEKMCSGAYIGKIAQLAIMAACKDNLFSYSFAKNFEMLRDLSAYQIDLYLNGYATSENVLENVCVLGDSKDRQLLTELLKQIIMRSAKITAAVIGATVLKSKPSKNKKVCITCNGSTFWKTFGLKKSVEELLYQELTEKHTINFDIIRVENDITVGTAIS
ncbi:MAG: hexokinase [Treponema sp.]|nr:hexokinase [Treponema sp.]